MHMSKRNVWDRWIYVLYVARERERIYTWKGGGVDKLEFLLRGEQIFLKQW